MTAPWWVSLVQGASSAQVSGNSVTFSATSSLQLTADVLRLNATDTVTVQVSCFFFLIQRVELPCGFFISFSPFFIESFFPH